MPRIDIQLLSRAEKLRTMEELWDSLMREESPLASPDWHRDALEQTSAQYDAGQETPLEWSDAKRELRKRSE
jgi:putative addiction module component (TIGR02574 family)